MQRLVECKLFVSSEINSKKDCVIISGKGYCKNDNEEIVVYFTSDDVKYKYVYNKDTLIVSCNDSSYTFKVNEYNEGKIKNGEYVFIVTTFASKIEIFDNKINLNYTLSQENSIIGKYESELSFN